MSSSQNYFILIVDDVIDNLLLLQTLLETEGYCIDTADSGNTALQKIQTSPPDLVLLDVMMPDMSGIEVLQHIRRTIALRSLSIVLVTAASDVNDRDAVQLGANEVIRKPVNHEELLQKVKVWCH